MVSVADDESLMRRALQEAKKGSGRTSPNPTVGAILVSRGHVIAAGHHEFAAGPHAEVNCFRNHDGVIPKDATLYVTLEPCSTTGRTPPCTEAIINAGIAEVVVGATDPNPRHAGRAIPILEAAGVRVRTGVLADECSAINRAFNKWIRTGRPFVIAKCGMTLDGRLTMPPGEQRWITTAAARQHANRRRAAVDAILVGAETLRVDNPRLTVRHGRNQRQPWRVVLTRSADLPKKAHVFTDAFADRTLVFRDESLARVLGELGQREITSVLIEGGGDVLGQALEGRFIDAVEIYLGPVLTGGPVIAFPGTGVGATADAVRLTGINYERVGADVFLSALTEASAPVKA